MCFWKDLENLFLRVENVVDKVEEVIDEVEKGVDEVHRSGNSNDISIFEPNILNSFPCIAIKPAAEYPNKLNITLNMKDYNPDDVNVTVNGRLLTIEAEAEKNNDFQSLQEISYKYQIPDDVDLDNLTSSIANDGILHIETSVKNVRVKDIQVED
jgi:HSP20 family molecular chaperone IbpA